MAFRKVCQTEIYYVDLGVSNPILMINGSSPDHRITN